MNYLASTAKADFPFFEKNPGVVYLDSAATSLTPRPVIDAIVKYYEESSSNIHRGVYKASQKATDVYENTRSDILRFAGAPRDFTAVFVRNTTEGINLLANSLGKVNGELKEHFPAWQNGFSKGDVILLSDSEHHSNIVPWQILAREKGFEIVYLPVKEDGSLDMEAFQSLRPQLDRKTVKAISLSKVSNVTGIIHDLEPFREYAKKRGAVFIIDGAQAICHSQINIEEMGCDFFVFSAHKMLGPTGVGALLGSTELFRALPPFLGGGDMILEVHKDITTYNEPPHKFEAGTPDVGGVYGFQAAISYLEQTGQQKIHEFEKELLTYTMKKMADENIRVHGPSLADIEAGLVDKVGVVSFEMEGIHPHDVGTILDEHNVCIRVGHHCCQLLMERWQVSATCRASFYMYNDYEDIDRLMEALQVTRKIFKRN